MEQLARRHGWGPTERGIADEFVLKVAKFPKLALIHGILLSLLI